MALLPNFVILLLSSMLVSRGHCDITMLLSSKMEPQHKKERLCAVPVLRLQREESGES